MPEQATAHDHRQSELYEFTTEELEEQREEIEEELDRRKHDIDTDDAERVELVNGRYVAWTDLSAHPNRKAGKAWILQVTGTHETYAVDGDWLDKQTIDGEYHMDVSDLSSGDIVKVSGASHNNKKHRYYRIVELTDAALYYTPECGLEESEVIEEVGD
jgi:HD-GYP domain-containing protein (c-di-GMP phosphodiesterase class II)